MRRFAAVAGLACAATVSLTSAAEAQSYKCDAAVDLAGAALEQHWIFRKLKEHRAAAHAAEQARLHARAATSVEECAARMEAWLATLGDGHLALTREDRVAHGTEATLQLRFVVPESPRAEAAWYVWWVDPGDPRLADLAGARVLAIDGIAPEALVEQLRPRIAASTRRQYLYRLGRALLAGPADSTVALRVQPVSGPAHEVALRRGTPREMDWQRHGDVGYVRIPRLDARAAELLRGALRRLDGADALVLDLRGVDGGDFAAVEEVLGVFYSRGLETAAPYTIYDSLPDAAERLDPLAATVPLWRRVARLSEYDGRLVVLVDAGCFAACDVLAASLQSTGRARIAGVEGTGGGSAQTALASSLLDYADTGPLDVMLPVKMAARPDGTLIEGRRVEPDVRVEDAPEPSRPDPVLSRAVELAREQGPVAALEPTDEPKPRTEAKPQKRPRTPPWSSVRLELGTRLGEAAEFGAPTRLVAPRIGVGILRDSWRDLQLGAAAWFAPLRTNNGSGREYGATIEAAYPVQRGTRVDVNAFGSAGVSWSSGIYQGRHFFFPDTLLIYGEDMAIRLGGGARAWLPTGSRTDVGLTAGATVSVPDRNRPWIFLYTLSAMFRLRRDDSTSAD